jgi:uncharacterized membrane protein YecN with MAPEG domain
MVVYLYSALMALMMIVFAFNVILRRQKLQVAFGHGGHDHLERAIRVHGNFAEFVPLALILMFLAEDAGTMRWVIHSMGILLVTARLCHAWGLTHGKLPFRVLGVVLTHAVLVTGAAFCLYFYFNGNPGD